MDNGASSYRRYLNGEESAFEELVEMYYDRLVFFINRYVQNKEDSEDIAIDCFAEVVAHPKKYGAKASFKTYLFAIGHHKAVDFIRKNKHVRLFSEEQDLSDVSSEGDAPFEFLVESEEKKALYSAISILPEEMQRAVYLIYFEDLSFEEAAKIMKKSKKQMYNLIYRSKAELGSILKSGGVMNE